VSFDDWILSLHVLSAAALVASFVVFWTLIYAVRRTDLPEVVTRLGPVGMIGNAAAIIGSIGTIFFGVWLALSYGGYDLWDGWILIALVLWVIGVGTGQRSGNEYLQGVKKAQELMASNQTGPSAELLALNRSQRGLTLQLVSSAATLLILIDMIWKPGA
jgi:uncharacterized membrane protein